jgi:hypothetical protein
LLKLKWVGPGITWMVPVILLNRRLPQEFKPGRLTLIIMPSPPCS